MKFASIEASAVKLGVFLPKWVGHNHWSHLLLLRYDFSLLLDYYEKAIWAICWLSFNQVTIIVVSIHYCFIVLFIRGGLYTGFVISVSINSMIVVVVISYVSGYTTWYFRLSILNYSTTLMGWLSKFELCFSKESTKFCLLTTSFLKNLLSISSNFLF